MKFKSQLTFAFFATVNTSFFSPRRVSSFLAWDDFHARSSFARSTIPGEKWGLIVVYHLSGPLGKQKFTLTCSKGHGS